ncbi:MAG: hypothetical protein BHV75_00115 [Bacteroides oleiciplenus]|nr:MAG: hypothetical protein BHV75_00115 [Bacteroides oleiciplenus]
MFRKHRKAKEKKSSFLRIVSLKLDILPLFFVILRFLSFTRSIIQIHKCVHQTKQNNNIKTV